MKKTIILIIIMALSIVVCYGQQKLKLKGYSKDGQIISINNSSKSTFIYCWATWCQPCIKHMDTINALSKQFPNVRFINIVYDSIYDYNRFVSRSGKSFNFETIINGENIIDSIAMIKYKYIEKGLAFPIVLIIDENKEIIFIQKRLSTKTLKRINDVLSKIP